VAEILTPHTLMARTSDSLDLEKIIPVQFGSWAPVPGIRLVEPPGSDTLSKEIYSQELARGYTDGDGHVVMLLIAYGASQSDRLQLHRPEICYTAQGFRVSRPISESLNFKDGAAPIGLSTLVATREARVEPILYWMRIGHDVANGVVERQILKVKYGLGGLIPDGALIRVSTTGLPEQTAFEVERKFARDLLDSVDPAARTFLIGRPN
jgi:EpsI family protein